MTAPGLFRGGNIDGLPSLEGLLEGFGDVELRGAEEAVLGGEGDGLGRFAGPLGGLLFRVF